MPFPFVSRARFDDERERRKEAERELSVTRERLETELRDSRERILLALKPREPDKSETLRLTEETDLSQIMPIAGKPTLATITSAANLEAQRRANTDGAKGIVHEMLENASKRIPKAKAVNG